MRVIRELQIGLIGMKQTTILCYDIEQTHRRQKCTRCNREWNLFSRPQKEHTQKQQRNRHTYRKCQHNHRQQKFSWPFIGHLQMQ